jgi:hypothetical protein
MRISTLLITLSVFLAFAPGASAASPRGTDVAQAAFASAPLSAAAYSDAIASTTSKCRRLKKEAEQLKKRYDRVKGKGTQLERDLKRQLAENARKQHWEC